MSELSIFLWNVFLIFTVVCLLLCIEAHFRYQNRRGIDEEAGFTNHQYGYFGQPIYNHHSLSGYELLLREYNQQTQQWQLPEDVIHFPLNRVVNTIQQIDPQITSSISVLAINMTVNQVTDFRAHYFFRWVLGVIGRTDLTVEISAKDIIASGFWRRRQLLHVLKQLDPEQTKITIENVDSSRQTYYVLRKYLPYIACLKFNISSFKKSPNHWIDITLAQWKRRAQQYHVTTAVSRVEEPEQVKLVNQLDIELRQGYVYGHPELLKQNH